ncbi:glycosyltransferase [Sulfuracidifex tepidarius]
MMDPLVTIVVATKNSAKTVEKTMESISRLNYRNFEILVVDGNSTDDTLRIVDKFSSKYKIRVIEEKRKGRGIAYNRGVLESRGKYVAFLDSDAMVATPGWIDYAVSLMEKDEKIGVVFTKVFAPPDSSFMQKAIDAFLCKGFATANGAIYRREAVIKVGGFNVKMNYMQEDELLKKLTAAGYKYVVNTQDIIYHYHRNNLKSYIEQNIESAIGARMYREFTGESWVIKDGTMRVSAVLFVVLMSVSLAIFYPLLLLPFIGVIYLGILLKVNRETCEVYKWSKYTLGSPFLIFFSLLGYSIGFLTIKVDSGLNESDATIHPAV